MSNRDEYKNLKIVPADNGSVWVLTNKDDDLQDYAWDSWKKQMKDQLKDK